MKITGRGGHNAKAVGCSGLIDEVTEDRKVWTSVMKYLKLDGNEVIDASPNAMDKKFDLAYGVNIANNFGAELFISIHFNNAYKYYNGSIGTETIIYPNSKTSYPYAKRINDNLINLGFKKHGTGVINDTRGLYELKHTNCPSVIVEVCFVEATEDVKLYKQLGAELIGKSIAEAIVGHEIKAELEPTNTKTDNNKNYKVNYCLEWQHFYNTQTATKKPLGLDGQYGANTQASLDNLYQYIKEGKKYKYCLEFQRFYNKTTKTSARLTEDGIFGSKTEQAFQTMVKLVKGEY